MKRCEKCKEHKPLSAFYKCAANRDGLQKRCKDCQREDVKVRMAKPHNMAKQAERARKFQREHRDRFNAYRREWAARSYAKDPKKWNEASDKYMAQQRAELGDAYMKALIAGAVGCKRADVPAALIAAKRAHLATKRLIQEKTR
jgi:hypothetical protein